MLADFTPPAPGSLPTTYDATQHAKHGKKHLLIANYAPNALECPCKALETACNAPPINLYS
uniref:Uncharacterized protein n=1 Tax=virus sp. ctqEG8 TaxID=2827998 RepID=A0A8S5RFF5_9VIRU|nr:MAG TPA: hypothetical protein [virus sp. ctqEG8]